MSLARGGAAPWVSLFQRLCGEVLFCVLVVKDAYKIRPFYLPRTTRGQR